VIQSEYLGTQYRLLVLDVELKCPKWKKMSVGEPRVKWWNFTKENARKLAERINEEGALRGAEDADPMWEAMTVCIHRSAKEILGTSRRGGSRIKGA